MHGSLEPISALYAQRLGADAVDLGAHFYQAFGDIAHLGLAGGVLDHGFAVGKGRAHHHRMRCANGDLGKRDACAFEALGCGGDHVAPVNIDGRAQRLEAHQMQVDRTRTNGTAARHRHVCATAARQQRAKHQKLARMRLTIS